MRLVFSVLYLILIALLILCAVLAWFSDKPARKAVAFLEAALIPPVLGNLLIVITDTRSVALLGCYFYYLGMDLVMGALVRFTDVYCRKSRDHSIAPLISYAALTIDALQMMLNPITGHAFTISEIEVEGMPYYKLIPFYGQTLHRVIDYAVFFSVILIFIIMTVRSPKIYRERYLVILATMIGVGLLQTYNIFFQYAIDRSMLGYGLFGVVIFFFALLYRPLRLLDRVLSNIVSELPDAFYVFDANGHCIWANDQGCKLADTADKRYDEISAKLKQMFGESSNVTQVSAKRQVGEGPDARYYLLEERYVKDAKGSVDGSYLRVQDVTAGEQQIGQIRQEAYRDSLTGVGSKAAYTKKVDQLINQIKNGLQDFAVVMVDMNNLKYINDDFGHEAGDLYIKGCCHLICDAYKHSPVFRIGGDEFVVILQGQDYERRAEITEELRSAYEEAFDSDKDPWLRYSAAVGLAEYSARENTYDLVFKRADHAMYAEKKMFKQEHGSYR